MECPFCKSEMHAKASVCPTCRRDIYLFKPLLARIGELEAQVEHLDAELQLAKRNDNVESNGSELNTTDTAIQNAGEVSLLRKFMVGALLFVLPVLLLLVTHWLLVFVYDVRVLVLRIVVLLIPLPFGFFLARRVGLPLSLGAFLALFMAGISVLGMSAITAHHDLVPVWPQSMIEWREFVEFALSIAFSTFTGLWLGRIVLRVATRAGSENWVITAAKRMSAHGSSPEAIKNIAGRLEKTVNTFITVATTAISIYTGFKGLFG